MKKLLRVLPVVIVVCLVFVNVFAVDYDSIDSVIKKGNAASGITTSAKNVWGTITTIVQILAVAAIVFAGVRYMFASADQKADIKKSMGILAIGAVLVFGATLVLNLIAGATSVINTN